ncbi:MAG: hypothetical protein IH853_14105 [Bacteroidetes bacterium]|nr:hypothetical protein [Bacteroidota bacterium]
MKERMKESYIKGLAIHGDPESCVVRRKADDEVLTGARTGTVLSREINLFRAPTQSRYAEGNTEGYRETLVWPCAVRCTCGTFMRENWEIPQPPRVASWAASGRPEAVRR